MKWGAIIVETALSLGRLRKKTWFLPNSDAVLLSLVTQLDMKYLALWVSKFSLHV
jgi:hypothetical protein